MLWGQGKKLKADDYFFQYAYEQAIISYERQLARGTYLNPQQQLNLADSYYKTNAFKKASKTYLDVYRRDTTMTNLQFNKMLQSFSVLGNFDKVDSLLAGKTGVFSKELLENMEFNAALLRDQSQNQGLVFEIFNVATNSPQSDFSPTFYGDNILFSSGRTQGKKRQYAPAGEGYLNIYQADILKDGQAKSSKVFSGIPPSNYHKATPFYGKALNTIFYVSSNMDGGDLVFDEKGKNALSITKMLLGGNGKPQLLLRDLSTSFYYPFFDETTGRLYFAADFGTGYGGTDLYYVSTNNGQVMSAPVNLGPRINSSGNEIAPYIFENSLFFASDVFYGLGGMDIYQSSIEADDAFSIPINLGSGINSQWDDFGMIIRNQGEGLLGYFASNRQGGKGNDDIYGFKVAEKPGLKTITLKGRIVKKYNLKESVADALVLVLDAEGNILTETRSDKDGRYRIEIPWQSEVTIQSSKRRFSVFEQKLGESELENIGTKDLDLRLSLYDDLVENREGQKVIKLQKFYFGRGRTNLDASITSELDKVVEFVKHFPEVQLRIETYTDSRGGSSTNFKLTQGRSDAIKSYLIQNGVPETKILYSVGYGEQKILNNCTNGVYCLEVLHKQNQRSLIVVLNDNLLFQD